MNRRISLFVITILSGLNISPGHVDGADPIPASDHWLTYAPKQGPGDGKRVVFIAADQEYRSEQSLPMLAKMLAERHGFHCTVLFSVNAEGLVDPTLPAPLKPNKDGKPANLPKHHRIPGLEHLAKADCLVWLSRFMQLSDDDMQHFHGYFDSGKPIIALRTANHGFWSGKPYMKDGKRVPLRELLGGTFMGHHGGWHRESTRGILVEANKDHSILAGVKDVWGTSDVYRCHNDKNPLPKNARSLVLGQPLVDLKQASPPNAKKEPLPIAWTTTWTGNRNRAAKIFHFTMGSAEDFENEGVRRLTVNGIYWSLGIADRIEPNRSVAPVGDYQALKAGFNYEKLGVKPRPVSYYE